MGSFSLNISHGAVRRISFPILNPDQVSQRHFRARTYPKAFPNADTQRLAGQEGGVWCIPLSSPIGVGNHGIDSISVKCVRLAGDFRGLVQEMAPFLKTDTQTPCVKKPIIRPELTPRFSLSSTDKFGD